MSGSVLEGTMQNVKVGAIFPQTELGEHSSSVKTYAQKVESLGFAHILAYDHVLGADPTVHLNWNGFYDIHSTFHEPFVLFGYLAAITEIELVTSVIILPQRQTALVAKQAAEVDLLSEGRFRLGVGLGWNRVEYEALGKSFGDRGQRIDEQIGLLRRLWCDDSVTFDGRWEQIRGAGLAPRPVQRPIPIWCGCMSEAGFRRAGRLADGWFPLVPLGRKLEDAIKTVNQSAERAGRDPAEIGMEGRIDWADGNIGRMIDEIGRWSDYGASHVSINTMKAGLKGVDAHLEALESLAEAASLTRE